jgi:hypothetical protein
MPSLVVGLVQVVVELEEQLLLHAHLLTAAWTEEVAPLAWSASIECL